VDLTEVEVQQSQAAIKTPTKGGRHKTSRPQKAQMIPSFLIKKSTSFFLEHLQASFPKVPYNNCAKLPCLEGN
jgi:hypothetical protein